MGMMERSKPSDCEEQGSRAFVDDMRRAKKSVAVKSMAWTGLLQAEGKIALCVCAGARDVRKLSVINNENE